MYKTSMSHMDTRKIGKQLKHGNVVVELQPYAKPDQGELENLNNLSRPNKQQFNHSWSLWMIRNEIPAKVALKN